jgi:hypothetical protein
MPYIAQRTHRRQTPIPATKYVKVKEKKDRRRCEVGAGASQRRREGED